jgi:hypothetical protein
MLTLLVAVVVAKEELAATPPATPTTLMQQQRSFWKSWICMSANWVATLAMGGNATSRL